MEDKDIKKKVGRPTKLTNKVITILTDIVDDAIYLTDEDLIFLLNEKLEAEEEIAIGTFKNYKSGKSQSNNEIISEFCTLIKKALIKEKIALTSALRDGEQGWQSKAWILERKFKEWNLKHISETDITTKGNELNVSLEGIQKIGFIDD